MKLRQIILSFSIYLLATPLFYYASSQDSLKTVYQYLQRDSGVLEAKIVTDFKQIFRKKYDRKYHDGLIIIKMESGDFDTMNVEIRTRGNARLKVCLVPPLKVKFSKKELRKRNLAEEPNSLKLVVGCRNSESYEQYVLREYLAYKLFRLLSEYSYSTQLVQMEFLDTQDKRAPEDAFAFFIEPDDEVAKRCVGKIAPNRIISTRLLNTDDTELFSFFQFMIGNTDWYLYNGHNVELLAIQRGEQVKIIPLPYDFDYSGFVNAPYAVVNEKLPTKEVTERHYQGYCRSESETLQTIDFYKSQKSQIMKLCENFNYLDEASKRHCINYINTFFEILENDNACRREVLNHCDKRLQKVEK